MAGKRNGWRGLLCPIVASLLILGAVGAELPELLSLVDNTSNDFVIQKTCSVGTSPRLAVALHVIFPLHTKCLGCRAFDCDSANIFRAAVVSSEVFLLHSVLRL